MPNPTRGGHGSQARSSLDRDQIGNDYLTNLNFVSQSEHMQPVHVQKRSSMDRSGGVYVDETDSMFPNQISTTYNNDSSKPSGAMTVIKNSEVQSKGEIQIIESEFPTSPEAEQPPQPLTFEKPNLSRSQQDRLCKV